jgi:NAD(P)-dependent dehydrogenase (short-subunit alcohol dehydrogenase family)
MRFSRKVAIVTGGASGMGKAAADILRSEGAVVYVLDIRTTRHAHSMKCDVADYSQVRKCVKTVVRNEGRIDLLFAAAGIHLFADIEQTSIEEFERVLSINLKGTFHILKEVLPHMRQRKYGNVVLMGSDQVFVGKGGSSVYGLTKAGIAQLAKSTAIDYAKHNIRVNCICPGTVDTPMIAPSVERFHKTTGIPKPEIYRMLETAQPIQRLGRPDEIARAVAFMLSDDSPFMTGALLTVDGGYTCQ